MKPLEVTLQRHSHVLIDLESPETERNCTSGDSKSSRKRVTLNAAEFYNFRRSIYVQKGPIPGQSHASHRDIKSDIKKPFHVQEQGDWR